MALLIVILDLRDRGEGYFDDLPIRTFDLYARSGESLGGFHTSNCAADAPAVNRDNLHVVLAIKWLQSRKCLGNFHDSILPEAVFTVTLGLDSNIALYETGSLSRVANATGKHYLAYRPCPCILRLILINR